jgi:hypothetical protein
MLKTKVLFRPSFLLLLFPTVRTHCSVVAVEVLLLRTTYIQCVAELLLLLDFSPFLLKVESAAAAAQLFLANSC